jgi:hypothetical protein
MRPPPNTAVGVDLFEQQEFLYGLLSFKFGFDRAPDDNSEQFRLSLATQNRSLENRSINQAVAMTTSAIVRVVSTS